MYQAYGTKEGLPGLLWIDKTKKRQHKQKPSEIANMEQIPVSGNFSTRVFMFVESFRETDFCATHRFNFVKQFCKTDDFAHPREICL